MFGAPGGYDVTAEEPMNGIVCAFQGRVPRDAELKYTQTGTAMLTFSVAVSDNKAPQDAPPEWVRVVAWGEMAESLEGRLVGGTECYVEGRLKLSEWTGRDGEHRAGLNVSAWTVQPMGQIGNRAPRPERAIEEARRQPAGRSPGAGAPDEAGSPEAPRLRGPESRLRERETP